MEPDWVAITRRIGRGMSHPQNVSPVELAQLATGFEYAERKARTQAWAVAFALMVTSGSVELYWTTPPAARVASF